MTYSDAVINDFVFQTLMERKKKKEHQK